MMETTRPKLCFSLFLLQIPLIWIITWVLVCPGKVWFYLFLPHFVPYVTSLGLSWGYFLSFLYLFSCRFFFFPFFSNIKTVTNFIMKAFINGRTLFGTPVNIFPPVYPSQMVSNYCLKTTFAYFGDFIQALTLWFIPGVFLWSWSSHWGWGGSQWSLLSHLWQDRPLHERLPHA